MSNSGYPIRRLFLECFLVAVANGTPLSLEMVTGKGLALHKKREANNLNVKLWADIAAERARITACCITSYSFVHFLFLEEHI